MPEDVPLPLRVVGGLEMDAGRETMPGVGGNLVDREGLGEDDTRLIPDEPFASRHEPRRILEGEAVELDVMHRCGQRASERDERLEHRHHGQGCCHVLARARPIEHLVTLGVEIPLSLEIEEFARVFHVVRPTLLRRIGLFENACALRLQRGDESTRPGDRVRPDA